VLFRPLARKIDQLNRATDVDSHYVLRFVCRGDDEAKLRVLLRCWRTSFRRLVWNPASQLQVGSSLDMTQNNQAGTILASFRLRSCGQHNGKHNYVFSVQSTVAVTTEQRLLGRC
jgi:hypothetical protein